MRWTIKWIPVAVAGAFLSLCALAQSVPEDSPCKFIAEAIQSAQRLKPGMTRADVEREYRADGGAMFFKKDPAGSGLLSQERFLYLKCEMIKIDVDLRVEGVSGVPKQSQADPIITVSRPYLELPFTD